MSRTVAAALTVLLTAACTGGDDTAAPDVFDTVLGTVDVDAAVGSDVVFYDLAPNPDGAPVALVGAAGARQSWLILSARGAPVVRTIPAAEPGSELLIADDGTPLVVGSALRVGGAVLPLPVGGPPLAVHLHHDTLLVARYTRLAAVDRTTGAVRATAAAPGRVGSRTWPRRRTATSSRWSPTRRAASSSCGSPRTCARTATRSRSSPRVGLPPRCG